MTIKYIYTEIKKICSKFFLIFNRILKINQENPRQDDEKTLPSTRRDISVRKVEQQRLAEELAILREKRFTLLMQCYEEFKQLRESVKKLTKNYPEIKYFPIFNVFFEPFIRLSEKVDYNQLIKNSSTMNNYTNFVIMSQISIFFYNYRDIIHDVSKALIYINEEDNPLSIQSFLDSDYYCIYGNSNNKDEDKLQIRYVTFFPGLDLSRVETDDRLRLFPIPCLCRPLE